MLSKEREKTGKDSDKVDGKLLIRHFSHIQLPPQVYCFCGTKEARNRQMTKGRIYHYSKPNGMKNEH